MLVADDVSDRPDPVDGGRQRVIDLDEPVFVGRDAGRIGIHQIGVRASTGRDQ